MPDISSTGEVALKGAKSQCVQGGGRSRGEAELRKGGVGELVRGEHGECGNGGVNTCGVCVGLDHLNGMCKVEFSKFSKVIGVVLEDSW